MPQYHIYHATSSKRFTEERVQPRSYVGFVETNTLYDAFVKSQNFDEHWNPTNPCRSTSVGDVIQGEGPEGEGFYMVKGLGYELLSDNIEKMQTDLTKEGNIL